MSSSGCRQTPHAQNFSPFRTYLRQEWQWIASVVCLNPKKVHVLHLKKKTRLNFTLNIIFSSFFESLRMDCERDPFFNLSNFSSTSFICSSSMRTTSSWTPSMVKSISNVGSSCRVAHLFPDTWWTLKTSLLNQFLLSSNSSLGARICFLVLYEMHSDDACCGCCNFDCCCVCHSSLRVTLGGGRGVESLSNSIRSPFWQMNL